MNHVHTAVCAGGRGWVRGAPWAGLPVPIPTGGGISCCVPREGASLGCGRGVALVGGLTSVVGSFLDVPLRVPCCGRFLFSPPPQLSWEARTFPLDSSPFLVCPRVSPHRRPHTGLGGWSKLPSFQPPSQITHPVTYCCCGYLEIPCKGAGTCCSWPSRILNGSEDRSCVILDQSLSCP